MPRTALGKFTAILAYFKTAPLAEVTIVLELAKTQVKERLAAPAPKLAISGPAAPAGRPTVVRKSTKQPQAATSASAAPRRKPGPKPGSHRRTTTAPAEVATAPDTGEIVGGDLPPQSPATDEPGLPLVD